MAKRVLVLTNEHLADANEVPESLLPLIDGAEEIYVVAPTLTTWLQSLAGDIDRACVSADERLHTVFGHMHTSGLDAHGAVGDEDQIAAIADALADFDADLIVLRLHVPGSRNENWREHRVAKRVRSQRSSSTSTTKGTPCTATQRLSERGGCDARRSLDESQIAHLTRRPGALRSQPRVAAQDRVTRRGAQTAPRSEPRSHPRLGPPEGDPSFDGELRFAFRHFPIGDAHPLALHAAEAAETAGAQGRFWEMHDLIYRSDQDLEPALLRKFAKTLGLDVERFDSELANETHLRHIMEDFQSGVDSGVNGTPTFFIDEGRLDWDFDIETLKSALEHPSRTE